MNLFSNKWGKNMESVGKDRGKSLLHPIHQKSVKVTCFLAAYCCCWYRREGLFFFKALLFYLNSVSWHL